MGIVQDQMRELDRPLDSELSALSIFKKRKVQCTLIFPDQSYSVFFKTFRKGKGQVFEMMGGSYFYHPKCFLAGKPTKAFWYYGNPLPIMLRYRATDLKADSLLSGDDEKALSDDELATLSQTYLDAESVKATLSSKVINSILARDWLTGKMVLVIVVAVFALILVVLQLTGKIDLFGWLTGKGGG